MSDFIHQQPIVLASASQSRMQLLQALGLQFEIVPANCDEENLKRTFTASKLELATLLASSKAMEVSQHYPDHFIIGADQLCLIDEQYLDKPMNHATAVTHLRLLSGKTHQQISACCLVKAGKIIWQGYETATLTMRELNNKTIESYLKLEQPYQSCGAYHYEGRGKWLFKDVHGSDSTIRGLPLQSLMQAMITYQVVLF